MTNSKRSLRVQFPLIFLLLLGIGAPGRSDTRLVFSAQHYRRESRDRVQPREPYHHLYLVNADGKHLTRITSGAFDDTNPAWSPDHKDVAFLRQFPSGSSELCQIHISNGRIFHLYQFAADECVKFAWAPHQRLIALLSEESSSASVSHFTIIHESSVRISVNDVREFVWSPDGRRLFIRRGNGRCEVLDAATKRSQAIPHIIGPVWLGDHRLLGVSQTLPNYPFVVFDLKARRSRLYLFDFYGDKEEIRDSRNFDPDHLSWRRSPANPSRYILEISATMSDGEHSWCYEVALGALKGKAYLIGPYEFGGYSPRGTQYAVFSHEWVGAYKRGGERLGELAVRNMFGKRTRSLTGKLVSIAGASWF